MFNSWNSPRAIAYRNVQDIPHDLGTAVNVVMMVFGPLLGAGGGAIGGFVAAGHPLTPRPARSWAVGLFARF